MTPVSAAPSAHADPAPSPSETPASFQSLDVHEHVNVARVIRSKIQPPPLRPTILSRGRLIDRLRAAMQHRVTLVIAEAGYGKTTLLADFSSRSDMRCLWYRLDETDADAITMANYLIATGDDIQPGFATLSKELLHGAARGAVGIDELLSTFVADLHRLPDTPTAIIFDDFHMVDQSADARRVLLRLLRDAPPHFRIVIASRTKPPLPLARMAASDELTRITTDDLRFSSAEIHQLFEVFGRPLDKDVVLTIDTRTRGWAASLQLLQSSIRDRSSSEVRSLAHAISGATNPIYDFLAEEVIGTLPNSLEQFVIRASLIEHITPSVAAALFDEESDALSKAAVCIAEAEKRGLLTPTSPTIEAREFHPLLRDYLSRLLLEQASETPIATIHLRLAASLELSDPLAACHHYIEAGVPDEAMRCLGQSIVLTMGSGRWGAASKLITRLTAAPVDPALAVIQARRLFEEGDIASAAALLSGMDVSDQPPSIRAALRQTRLSIGWRSGNDRDLAATLTEIRNDPETPGVLRDIAQVFIDADPLSAAPAPFPVLARRLEEMAVAQAGAGYHYYAAVSLHNAAIAMLSAGRPRQALELALGALDSFEKLPPGTHTSHATHAVMAICELELGNRNNGLGELREATSSPDANGDVHASCAFAYALVGERDTAQQRLAAAERLTRVGRTDISGAMSAGFAQALLSFSRAPSGAVQLLEGLPSSIPLDLELHLQHKSLLSLSHLLAGSHRTAAHVATDSLAMAKRRSGRRFDVRLSIVASLANRDGVGAHTAIIESASVGELALLETADALVHSLGLLPGIPAELHASIAKWPHRWLPALRRQLGAGDTSDAHAAALLLDQYGTADDVGLLRAFDRTYRKKVKGTGLGRALVRRVSPHLLIRDLGRVTLVLGEREVPLSRIRRKPASLLMYLVTRPGFTATREQVLDDLWPDSDPSSAANSLNQSLFFVRHAIDPWYEDDVSPDYVCFEGEVLWLDRMLTSVASADFVEQSSSLLLRDYSLSDVIACLETYTGQFSPEFEYEDWAMPWRTRVHAAFLRFATSAIDAFRDRGDLSAALAVAQRTLVTDPEADEVERSLISLYWKTGAKSAATTAYERLAASIRADGLDPPSLTELLGT